MGIKQLLFLAAIVLCIPRVNAQDDKFKALFMYNFTKYLEWPTQMQQGNFVIGVYGSSPVIAELNIIAGKRGIGRQKLEIRKINELAELTGCHIVYVPEARTDKLSQINKVCKNHGIVLISDGPGLAKSYAGLNYIKVNGKLNFEINRQHIENEGIKVNTALFSLGIQVDQ
ncbi:MAG: YfiR family protein [Bacteroidales bacterium]|nr:YfiR family protein [Bacteroidales bacterium]